MKTAERRLIGSMTPYPSITLIAYHNVLVAAFQIPFILFVWSFVT